MTELIVPKESMTVWAEELEVGDLFYHEFTFVTVQSVMLSKDKVYLELEMSGFLTRPSRLVTIPNGTLIEISR